MAKTEKYTLIWFICLSGNSPEAYQCKSYNNLFLIKVPQIKIQQTNVEIHIINSSYLSIKVKATKRSIVRRRKMIFAYVFFCCISPISRRIKQTSSTTLVLKICPVSSGSTLLDKNNQNQIANLMAFGRAIDYLLVHKHWRSGSKMRGANCIAIGQQRNRVLWFALSFLAHAQ